MAELDVTAPVWRKSTRSGSDNACVEVAFVDARVGIRDSQAPGGAVLLVSRGSWRAFVGGVRSGNFTRP